VDVETEPFAVSAPRELSDVVTRPGTNFAATKDGQRFLVTVPAGSGSTGDTASASSRLIVVLNWFEELQQLAPTGR